MATVSAKRDHFNVLIVCALQSELQAAKQVLENGTKCIFVNKYKDLPRLNMLVCEEWNSTSLKVAMTAQPNMGGIETQRHVSELGKHFTANVVVMTGICAGDENKYGNVEHGSVVIAKRTTVVQGGKEKDGGEFETFAQVCDLNKRLIGAIDELVEEGNSPGSSAEWVKYVPDHAKRPSPRYVRDCILECVFDNPNIMKRKLFQKLEKANLPGMRAINYDQVLDIMKNQDNPWVRASGKFHDEYVVTDAGEEYLRTEAGFLRDDVIIGIFDSMIAIPNVTENLKNDIKNLKKRAGNRKVKAVDMESHFFMEQTADSFAVGDKPGLGVVMKGISDYGTQESKVDYYQVFAASTSAAFLRHLMTKKQYLFEDPKPFLGKSESHSTSVGRGKPGAYVVLPHVEDLMKTVNADRIIQSVVDAGAHLWFDIGQRMGFKAGKLTAVTGNKIAESSKLRALIASKQADVGKAKAIELLLRACQDVKIYGGVVDDLQGS